MPILAKTLYPVPIIDRGGGRLITRHGNSSDSDRYRKYREPTAYTFMLI